MYKQIAKQDSITNSKAIQQAKRRAIWATVVQAAKKRTASTFQPFAY